MSKIFARFLKDESGATAIEYGLIAALISVALIAGATTIGTQINTVFTNIGTRMTTAATNTNTTTTTTGTDD
ncbi:pilus assembly protein Flp/PilA [Agrobacterium vitis]|nr:pilus assembly protein Flp/PilA [Agrobacterium vitis]MBE1437198.1 pilus assembly protein Flp/PilA [Agrobacterium vitis]